MKIMTKTGITEAKVYQEIIRYFKKNNIFVVRKGQSIIPKCVDDLPPSIKLYNSVPYEKAYQRLYAGIKRARAKKINNVELIGDSFDTPEQSRTRIGKRRMLNALSDSKGVVTHALNTSGVTRTTFYLWVRTDDVFAKEVSNWEESSLSKVEAKPIATPKLEAKKLVVNLSDTMTCTITSDGLITVDFK